jgi:GPH family glycoside/pentoside/hexuronide:cation symporter
MRERPEHAGRGAHNPIRALRDVGRNPHARLLLAVFFIQQLGIASLTVTTPFFTQYVLGSARYAAPILAAFLGAGTLSVPVWIGLSRRFEKKPLMISSMAAVAAVIGSCFFLGGEHPWLVYLLVALAGIGAAGADVMSPSIQADVIDYDELRTGERKEGTYFAVWSFAIKTGGALMAAVVGSVLATAGYEPNREQGEGVILAIRALFAGFPCLCYTTGLLLFFRFRLSEREHGRIRDELDRRATSPV